MNLNLKKRNWDREYNLWMADNVNNPKPGPHPDPKHQWNKNREKFIVVWLTLDEDLHNSDSDYEDYNEKEELPDGLRK